MTKRQQWLIATLRAAKGAWLSELEIVYKMVDDSFLNKFPKGEEYLYNHRNVKGSHCPSIWRDMDEINQDPDADAIIITKDRKFAIAMSELDVEELLLSPLKRKASNSFRRYWNIKRKANMQWQGQISFTEEQEMKFYDLFKGL